MQPTAPSTPVPAQPGAGRTAARRGIRSLRRREALTAYLTLLPAFLLVAAVIWYPVTRTAYQSFTEWNGAVSTWVGWENYQRIVSNGDLWLLMRNNLIFVASVPGILLISLVVTVLLYNISRLLERIEQLLRNRPPDPRPDDDDGLVELVSKKNTTASPK